MNQAVLNRARKDKFLMVLDIPKSVKKMHDIIIEQPFTADSLQFTCYGSPVPAMKVDSIDVAYGGQVHKTSSNFRDAYPALDIPFYIDNGWINYYTLFTWLNLFNDQKTGKISMNYKFPDEENQKYFEKIPLTDLVTTFSTFVLDEYNNKIMKFTYTNAFPILLDSVILSHQDAGEASSKVSFAFNQVHCELLRNVNDAIC